MATSLNPLLSEAVFSITIFKREYFYGRRRLNPLLSEAVFSIGLRLTGPGRSNPCLNPLLSEAVFSMEVLCPACVTARAS